MIEWRRLYVKPAGSLPGGVITQYGVGAITVFVLLFLTYWIWFGGGEPAGLPGASETEATAPKSFTDRMDAKVEAESLRAETQAAAADRALRAQQQQQTNTARVDAGRVTANEALLLAGPSPDTGQPYTEEEWELRERLRLEAVERRSRSLRSSPIAQTYRRLDGGGGPGRSSVHRSAERAADRAGGRAGRSRRDCGERPGAGLFFPGADRGAGRPPRLGAYLRRLVLGSGARVAAFRRLPRPGAGRGFRSFLLGGPATHPGSAWCAGDRHGSGRGEPGSIPARRELPPSDSPGRALGFARLSRPQPTR